MKIKKASNSKMIKAINEKSILNLIYMEGPIPRVKLAEKTGLSQQTITNIVNRLLSERIVLETSGVSNGGGRKPIPLIINGRNMYAIGIEIAVKYIRGTLMDFENNIITESIEQVPIYRDEEQPLKYIFRVVERLLEFVPNREALKGIGCSIQGIVDSENGIVVYAAGVRLNNFPLKEKIQEHFGYPVYLQNDANLLAIVENLNGTLASSRQNITLKFDYGIGGAAVVNKQLVHGADNVAFEFGHYKAFMGKEAYPCHCGSKGCLTTLASLSGLKRNEGYLLEEFSLGVREKNKQALQLFGKLESAISYAIANVITLLNPDHVLLTGQIIDTLTDELVPLLEQHVRELIPESCKKVKLIQLSKTPDESKLAVGLVMHEFFAVPIDQYYL
ncbi:ROK family transcriptional regulator [Bacillus niameyensis]|uniref:ROK family transcriptional regulator n=1 Tax=Bacillus niameyensis TaxID=1522308 RepID=UPI0007830910|nr:ROK family transcriptional regulator [Bacillus niameyensis]